MAGHFHTRPLPPGSHAVQRATPCTRRPPWLGSRLISPSLSVTWGTLTTQAPPRIIQPSSVLKSVAMDFFTGGTASTVIFSRRRAARC
jgi:hypothetical protein